ncbi:hypothetical protein ACQ4PT_070232 [Festuca glaucescens]
MSALLRHTAARRLGGSMVQRAQAAFAEERRRLGPRLKHTDESVRKEVMLKIQQKKEELYDAISNAEKEHRITDWWNRRLLRNLSVQVAPRPYDRNWYWLRIKKKLITLVEFSGLVSLPSGIAIGSAFVQWPGAEKEKVAQPVLASKSNADNLV